MKIPDRVRIYDLNKKYLRFDESIDLVDFAKQLLMDLFHEGPEGMK